MNIKQTVTIVTTGGAIAAWLAGSTTGPNRTVTPPPVVGRAPIEARGAALASEVARLHDHLQPSVTPRQPARNLFRFHATPPPSPPAGAAPRVPETEAPALPPPLPPLRLVGMAEDAGPNGPVRIAFISTEGQLFSVKEGET